LRIAFFSWLRFALATKQLRIVPVAEEKVPRVTFFWDEFIAQKQVEQDCLVI